MHEMLAINSLHPVQRRSITFTYMMNFLLDECVCVWWFCVRYLLHCPPSSSSSSLRVCSTLGFLVLFSIDFQSIWMSLIVMPSKHLTLFNFHSIPSNRMLCTYPSSCMCAKWSIRSIYIRVLVSISFRISDVLNSQVEQRSIHYFFCSV